MTGFKPAGTRLLALFLVAMATSLAGCSSIDQAMQGGTEAAAQPPANATAQAAPPEAGVPPPSEASPTPAPAPEGAAPVAAVPTAPVTATTVWPPPVARMAPITIQPGADTGTAVGRTVSGLRSQLQARAGKVSGDAQRLADLKSSSAQA